MKKTLLWMALTISAAAFAAAPDTAAPLTLEPAQPQILAAGMTADLLTRYHYTPTPLDDAMSRKIFDRYLKLLDADKMLFTQADVERFSPAREQLDDAIKSRDLSTPFAIFKLYQQRQRERLVHARALLGQRFDFSDPAFVSTEDHTLSPNVHVHKPRFTVVHVHREGTTWDEFLRSLG